jgi:hypothetical protein
MGSTLRFPAGSGRVGGSPGPSGGGAAGSLAGIGCRPSRHPRPVEPRAKRPANRSPPCGSPRGEMGGHPGGSRGPSAFPLPSGRSPARSRAPARLRGPSTRVAGRMRERSSARPSWSSVPSCPTPTISVGPIGHPMGLPLLGLSKDHPSVVLTTPESTPGDDPRGSSPSGRSCHGPSMFRPRGFPPPRRFAPPMPRACVATRSRPWGSPRFRTGGPERVASSEDPWVPPRGAALPFEAFPPSAASRATAAHHRNGLPRSHGRAVVTGVSPRRSPPTLPPRPFPSVAGHHP